MARILRPGLPSKRHRAAEVKDAAVSTWQAQTTMTPIQFEDNVVRGQLELHTEEDSFTFEITEEAADGLIKAMHQFRIAARSFYQCATTGEKPDG